MAKLRFLPSGIEREARPGQTVFEIGWKDEVGLQSACVGKGTCGLCRVRIVAGEELLNGYTETEDKHLGNLYHLTKLRLSCQCIVAADADDEGLIEVEVRQKKSKRDKSS